MCKSYSFLYHSVCINNPEFYLHFIVVYLSAWGSSLILEKNTIYFNLMFFFAILFFVFFFSQVDNDKPCEHDYRGESAASEPETKALTGYLKSIKNRPLVAYFSIHTYSQLIITPYGFTKTEPIDGPLLVYNIWFLNSFSKHFFIVILMFFLIFNLKCFSLKLIRNDISVSRFPFRFYFFFFHTHIHNIYIYVYIYIYI